MTYALEFFQHFIALFLLSAQWLLLGLVIAGLIHELVPVSILQKHMGDSSVGAVTKAAFIGAPLPLCSCGVIPAALGLRRSGASKPSTVSFLVATPETGVDSVSVSYALLGPVFAIARPISAVLSAIYAGLLVKFFGDSRQDKDNDVNVASSCCSVKKPTCCGSTKAQPQKASSIAYKLKTAFGSATGKLLKDITFWLLVGLVMAALIQTFVPTEFFVKWGDGLITMLVMALIGIPMYICATASTPLAVGFLSMGISPGAILVFLLAGPATNVSTMGMISKEMGKRTLILYLLAVGSSSIGLGYLLNILFEIFNWTIPNISEHAHFHEESNWLPLICGILLGFLMLKNYLPKIKQGTTARA